MRNDVRLKELARRNGAEPARHCEPLAKPSTSPDFDAASYRTAARDRLADIRRGCESNGSPSKGFKGLLRSKSKKDELADPENWTFTLNERRDAVDATVRAGGPVGLVQALIDYHPHPPFDVNIRRQDENRGHFRRASKSSSHAQQSDWLEVATANGSIDLIRLLASRGANSPSLDRALGVALSRSSTDAVRELIRYGADPNGYHDHFRRAVESDNIELVQMLLQSSRHKISAATVNAGLLTAVIATHHGIAAVLLAHGADCAYQSAGPLMSATRANDLRMLSLLLVECSTTLTPEYLVDTASIAVGFPNYSDGMKVLELLLCAGAPTDAHLFENQLLAAVQDDQLPFLSLLVGHGVSPDRSEAEAVQLSVSQLKLDYLEMLLRGTVTASNASKAIERLPQNVSEEDALKAVKLLARKSIKPGACGRLLAFAVEQRYLSLTGDLVKCHASIDYDTARAVRTAISRRDMDLLKLLLKASSTKDVLSKALPDAMRIPERGKRRQAATMLLEKGVTGPELDIALRDAIDQSDRRDPSLVDALLRHNASVDYIDPNGNCIHLASEQGDLEVLRLLCAQNHPSQETVSTAIHVAFDSRYEPAKTNALETLKLLLSKDVRAREIAMLLIKAVRNDAPHEIVALLLSHGADVNHRNGAAVEEALKAPRHTALEAICQTGRIAQETLERLVPTALARPIYDHARASLIVGSCAKYPSILNRVMVEEARQQAPRDEVVKVLLRYGASSIHEDGAALSHAARQGNLNLARILCAASPNRSSLAAGFQSSMALDDSNKRHEMMEILLTSANGQKIGQDDALIVETRTGVSSHVPCGRGKSSYDQNMATLSIVRMLLRHGANVNCDRGAALRQAVTRKSADLITLILSGKPNNTSLSTAFSEVRQLACSIDEKHHLFKLILDAGVRDTQIDTALVEAISRNAGDVKIPHLLVSHNASVDFDRGHALELAATSGNKPLLELLVGKRPNPASSTKAFAASRQATMDERNRTAIFSCLLGTGDVPVDQASAAMAESILKRSYDLNRLHLLLDHGASLDYNDGQAICTLVKQKDIASTAALLEKRSATAATLDRAFDLCLALDRGPRMLFAQRLIASGVSSTRLTSHLGSMVREKDHELLQLMVQGGADPDSNGGESMQAAAETGDAIALEKLISSRTTVRTIDNAFRKLMETRAVETSAEGLRSAQVLLRHGVSESLKSAALLDALQSYQRQRSPFVRALLAHGANVNHRNGRCFVAAGESGDWDLFDALLDHGPNINVITPTLIRSISAERKLIDVLQRCFNRVSVVFDPGNNAVLFLAMEQFPRGADLVKLLLSWGCSRGTTRLLKLKPETEREPLTPLIWALYRPRPGVSDSVILALLEDGSNANLSFVTGHTEVSAITKAAKAGREAILRRLIELGADVSFRDAKRRSPLYFASRNGNGTAVGMLVNAGARPNDGSLNEAAKGVHADVVKFLLSNKHDPNDAPPTHSGRSPLAELCRHAEPDGREWESKAYHVVEFLLQAGTDLNEKYDGKSILHLALDSDHPLEITRVLLEFPQIWKQLSDDIFLFEDSLHICCSPTMYVKHFYEGSATGMRQSLLQLLEFKRCKDRRFSRTGEFRDDFVGFPEHMNEAVQRQSLLNQEHAESLRRRRADAELEFELSGRLHQQSMQQSNERHRNTMSQALQIEARDIESNQRKHETHLAHRDEIEQSDRRAIEGRHRLLLENESDTAVQRRQIANTDHDADVERRKQIALVDQKSMDAKASVQRHLLRDQEEYESRRHTRDVRLLDRQDESVKVKSREMQAVAAATRNASIGASDQRAIGWPD